MKKIIPDQISENKATIRCFHNFPKTLFTFSGFFWLFIIISTFIASEGFAQVSPGIAPVYPPSGGFHIEGDLKANTPTVNKGDWVTGVGGIGGNVLNDNGSPINPARTYHLVDKWDDQTDEKFKGGDKFHDNPNTWEYVTHKAVPKLDINNALIHLTTDTTNGQVWAIISADRFSEHGDAYMDFEFYQDSLYTDNTGNFHSDAPASTGGRTVGDFVLTVHFGNNIDTEFEVYRWENTGGTTYDYVLYTSLPAGSVFASSNTTSVPVPYPAFGLNNYTAKTFVEAAVNLSQVLGSMNACVDISITSILIKTKSSHSLTADLDDFLGPLQVTDFSFGNAEAGNAQTKYDNGDYTVFTMEGSAVPSPGFTLVSHTWSVVSYDGTAPNILNPGDLNTDVWVYGTTAILKLTVVTTNGSNICSVDDTVVLTVIPDTDPDINVTFVNVPVPGDVNTNDEVPMGTTYGTTPTMISSPGGSTPVITMNPDGTYIFVTDVPGVYVYDVPVCAPGSPTPPCVSETLTITVTEPLLNNNPPIANTDIATTKQGVPVTLNTLVNDAAGNVGGDLVPSTVAIVPGTEPDPVTEGSVTVNPVTGEITFSPVANFTGVVTYGYTVCDNSLPALCAAAIQQVTIYPTGIDNTTDAADDFNTTPQGATLTVSIGAGVLSNDSDPEGNTQIVTTTSPMTVTGKGTVTIAGDGSYVFVPVPGFFGPVSFPYTVCDNGTPMACANATLYILVTPYFPDITPNITAEPNVMHGVVHFAIIVKVTELNNSPTDGLITVLVPKDTRWHLDVPYDPTATMLENNTLNNNNWSYSSDVTYHIFTSTDVIPASGASQFGFMVEWNSGFTTGTYSITSQIMSWSGGENRIDNNVDAEKLDYFIY